MFPAAAFLPNFVYFRVRAQLRAFIKKSVVVAPEN
jgi:hypothetical protein